MNESISTHFKCALYVRVSTEEQAENPEGSIRNQEERLRQTVRYQQDMGKSSDIAGVYVDAGLSAKDMNRPALQRLLKAVEVGDVNLVMVTELSRLSRSTKDFEGMWEFFKSKGCEFHSLRENFDTTTAAGELMLKSFANFAEFERKQTAERISASFKVRAERGLYNGGNVPFGYSLSATPGRLDVNPEEAEVVRIAYKAFLREGTLSSACLWLNANGYTLRKKMEGSGWMRAGHFNVDTLHKILTNKAYIGIKVYTTKSGKKEAKAVWQAIIDEVTFVEVKERLSKNHCAKKPESASRFPFVLTEVIYCGVCGEKLCGKSAHGKTKKHPYYEHSRRTKIQSGLAEKIYNCDPHRIPAEKAEEMVWQDIEQLLSGNLAQKLISSVMTKRNKNQFSSEIERLKNKTYSINAQTDALTLRLAELPREVSAAPIYKQMEKLGIEKRNLEERILKLKDEELDKEVPTDAITYEKFLDILRDLKASGITTAKKQKIITSLVERIEIFPDRLEIHYGLGISRVKRELAIASSLLNKSLVESSTSLTSGGTNRT
ncbi:MAG: recombinase family protein [Bacteriovoracaceae bacterium]|nr:recombinase family protein [Bacteriovoracaceae bacterium]